MFVPMNALAVGFERLLDFWIGHLVEDDQMKKLTKFLVRTAAFIISDKENRDKLVGLKRELQGSLEIRYEGDCSSH